MRNRPIVQAAVLWVAGYVVAEYAGFAWLGWRVGVVCLLAWSILGVFKPPGTRYVNAALLLLVAACYFHGYDDRNSTSLAHHAFGSEVRFEGSIISTVEVDGDKVSLTVQAERIETVAGTIVSNRSERLQVSIRLLEQSDQAKASSMGRGDRIVLTGTLKAPEPARNFGGFDYRRYLYRHHIHGILTVKGLSSVQKISKANESGWSTLTVLRWNDDLREYLGGRFDLLFDPEQAGYMKSLVLGITEHFDPDRYQQFSRLGLTHVLAISGLHVAVVVAGCLGLLRLLGLTREKTLVITMVIVPLYTAIAGGSPSVVRAGLMAMIALYAARRNLLKDGLHILSAVALIMLLWEPYYLYDVSFQLSFIVTAGLIVGVPRFSSLLPIRSPALKSAIAVTSVAQLISFPISIYYFNSFSLLSWFANLLLVPFISFITLPLGSVALLISLVWLPAGGWIARLADLCNRMTFWVVEAGASVHFTQMIWRTPSLLWIAAYFAGLVILYMTCMHLKWTGTFWRAVAAAACMIVLMTYAYQPLNSGRAGTISFIDVGQGDAILIRSPQGRTMLIDGGGTISFRKPGEEWKERRNPYEVGAKLLVPLLKKRGIHIIDYVVISHQDADHIGGLQAVLEQIPVKHLLFNDSWKGNDSTRKLFETARQRGVQLLGGGVGDTIVLDAESELAVLAPDYEEAAGPVVVNEQNGASLVLLMKMFDSRFLFTGDIGVTQEKEMLARLGRGEYDLADFVSDTPVPIDVLKIAHHGSKTSTAAEWLAYWQPKQVVISVGANNTYGHPNPQVLERIRTADVTTLRTDLQGEIAYTVTPHSLRMKRKLGE